MKVYKLTWTIKSPTTLQTLSISSYPVTNIEVQKETKLFSKRESLDVYLEEIQTSIERLGLLHLFSNQISEEEVN